jgi:hypothetical protein
MSPRVFLQCGVELRFAEIRPELCVTINSVQEICQSRKLLIRLSPLLRMSKSESSQLRGKNF